MWKMNIIDIKVNCHYTSQVGLIEQIFWWSLIINNYIKKGHHPWVQSDVIDNDMLNDWLIMNIPTNCVVELFMNTHKICAVAFILVVLFVCV